MPQALPGIDPLEEGATLRMTHLVAFLCPHLPQPYFLTLGAVLGVQGSFVQQLQLAQPRGLGDTRALIWHLPAAILSQPGPEGRHPTALQHGETCGWHDNHPFGKTTQPQGQVANSALA
jgi:hypothetical protein